jgi:hypothetical protein
LELSHDTQPPKGQEELEASLSSWFGLGDGHMSSVVTESWN